VLSLTLERICSKGRPVNFEGMGAKALETSKICKFNQSRERLISGKSEERRTTSGNESALREKRRV